MFLVLQYFIYDVIHGLQYRLCGVADCSDNVRRHQFMRHMIIGSIHLAVRYWKAGQILKWSFERQMRYDNNIILFQKNLWKHHNILVIHGEKRISKPPVVYQLHYWLSIDALKKYLGALVFFQPTHT